MTDNVKRYTGKVLPEPGVDVFIVAHGKQMLARRIGHTALFIPAFAPVDKETRTGYVRANEIERWDYAVPAGDML